MGKCLYPGIVREGSGKMEDRLKRISNATSRYMITLGGLDVEAHVGNQALDTHVINKQIHIVIIGNLPATCEPLG